MDHRNFDSLVASLAAPAGRRGTLRALLGTGLSLALGRLALSDAVARKKRKKHKNKKKKGHHRKKRPAPPDCTANCAGRDCGDDGCGGSCGTCPDGQSCTDTAGGAACQAGPCTPDCAGRQCGPDGCGGFCGACSGGESCSGGQCQCATTCAGACCSGGQSCLGNACWPDSEELAFGTLLKAHRAAHGLPALGLQNQLGEAAELHSQDQARHTFSNHTGSDGSTPPQRITRAGYAFSWWAENIYYGGGTAAAAFDWWKNSPGHNANMLSTNVTEFGIGRAHSDQSGYWYWTTTFGRP